MASIGVKPSLLIVEDDEFLRDLYVDLLTEEGFQVTSAEDGALGMNELEHRKYDLVLLDIMLPKKDGMDILRSLHTQYDGKLPSPVVLLTNLGQESIIQEGLSLGATGYLIKSELTPDQVVEKVKEFLTKKDTH